MRQCLHPEQQETIDDHAGGRLIPITAMKERLQTRTEQKLVTVGLRPLIENRLSGYELVQNKIPYACFRLPPQERTDKKPIPRRLLHYRQAGANSAVLQQIGSACLPLHFWVLGEHWQSLGAQRLTGGGAKTLATSSSSKCSNEGIANDRPRIRAGCTGKGMTAAWLYSRNPDKRQNSNSPEGKPIEGAAVAPFTRDGGLVAASCHSLDGARQPMPIMAGSVCLRFNRWLRAGFFPFCTSERQSSKLKKMKPRRKKEYQSLSSNEMTRLAGEEPQISLRTRVIIEAPTE
jgi:hypothetical protein